jgi:hypothetical protein
LADDVNRGAYLEPGVLVAEIGDLRHCEAVATVGQSDVLFVRPGAEVDLLIDVGLNRRASGRVIEVGRTIKETSDRRTSDGASNDAEHPIEYQVQIVVEDPIDGATFDAPIHVNIAAPRESIGAKLLRVLAQTFRFH